MVKQTKKVYRSDSDYMIAGVCGGIGEYFQIDATLVRILFVLLAIGGGAGIIIYIILALVIPKKGMDDYKENIEDITDTMEKSVKNISKEIKHGRRFNVVGLMLILAGGVILWNKFSPIRVDGEIFWPVILIILGVSVLFKNK